MTAAALNLLCLVTMLLSLKGALAFKRYKDTNPEANPCAPLQAIAVGDAITVAVALAGNRSMWYNASDPSLNVLSPCSPSTATQIPTGAQVTVFRPMVDQLSLFQIYNETFLSVSTTFPSAASLVVYTGYNNVTLNETVVSQPRTFSTPAVKTMKVTKNFPTMLPATKKCTIQLYGGTIQAQQGKVGGLLLVMEFEKGMLQNLTWKDDDCHDCGNNTALCVDHNCATATSTCANHNITNPDLCFTRINVAFSGTDRNSVSFTSWMNVKSVTKYSLSALYFSADVLLQKGIQSIIDEDNQVGTGGAV